MEVFSQQFQIRWSDVDANSHVRHSVYADYCATLRMNWLKANGFSYEKLRSLGIGPILFKETTSYLRELKPNSLVTVNICLGSMSSSGHKWSIDHEIFGDSNIKAAHLVADGAWFHVKDRKVVPPPEDLKIVMEEAKKQGIA